MKDDIRYANEKSGLDNMLTLWIVITSYMFGTIITVGILCDFKTPTNIMGFLMIGTLIPFFIISIILGWVATIRDRLLKQIRSDKKCYFCGTRESLKAISLHDDEDEAHPEEKSCCYNCFNDPDNNMEEAPIDSMEWYSTDYNWKTISRTEDTK